MTEFYEKILPQISDLLTKNQLQALEEFFHLCPHKYQKNIILFCLNYTILKNQTLVRKTGVPNVVHALHVALQAIQYELDYTTVCAALLHDTVEDQVEEITKSKTFFLRDQKENFKTEIRKTSFEKFALEFTKFAQKQQSQQAELDMQIIIDLVDILTRYKTKNQHYYHYIKSNFGIHNTSFDVETIFNAILVKFIDRTDNILTMDTKLKKIINNKMKAELRILDLIDSERIKKKYRKILSEQNSLLVDYSFSGGNRLNQIWKNTYLLIRARMFFCKYPELHQQATARKIENALIDNTLKVVTHHKTNVRVYISNEIANKWDDLARMYNELGGLDGRTPMESTNPPKGKEYLIFNSTLDIFSQYLLKNNREFKKLQIDKETQYKYLALINEMLMKFKKDSNFVCDLSKEIELKA